MRSLEIREAQLGADHPDTATSLNNLAELYRSMGRYGEAEPLYARALSVAIKALGKEHPNTQTVESNLTELIKDIIEAGQADQLWDHPLTQALLHSIESSDSQS